MSCKSCVYYGFDIDSDPVGVDICGIDGINCVDQGYQQCDRYNRAPGADKPEDTIDTDIISLCQDAEMDGIKIQVIYDEENY